MEILVFCAAVVLGVLVGGLINILADDLPMRQTPRLPHYPDDTPRPATAWLGITAFLTGQRESPYADDPAVIPAAEPLPVEPAASIPELPVEPIDRPESVESQDNSLEEAGPIEPEEPVQPRSRRLGWRYPLVEIVTGLAFGLLAVGFSDEKNLPFWFVYMAILILVTVIDLEHRLILFAVIIPACVYALIVAAVSPEEGKPFTDFLFGGVLGFALFFAMFLGGLAFSAFTQNDEVAFGFGDVMLAMLSGLILGWQAFIFASLITVFVGALGAFIYVGGRTLIGRRYQMFTPLPYGPYIVIGTLIMLLFRDDVRQFLQGG